MTYIDRPSVPFPNHSVPGVLGINGEDVRVSVLRLGIDDRTAAGDAAQRCWWADLAFHPLRPPAQDTECTLHFGGTIGRGHLPAGSTRMLGDGPPPTIRVAYVGDEGSPEMTARPDPAPERLAIMDPDADHVIHAYRPSWLNADVTASGRTAARENTLTARLEGMLANLDAHIDRRAQELAQPLIDQARQQAAEKVRDGQAAQQRAEDLVAELRRQIRALESNREHYRKRAEKAEAGNARVRELHSSVRYGLHGGQKKCHCANPYPCPTIRALDGQELDRD